ncbi:hypothetical protein E2I00_009831, partial [Balaenoptera physalus]
GKKFVGDLQPDGRIVWQETGQVFNSPSAWATHCKKLVNPAKKSGCGWASVKYKGQKLDKYKAAWLRRNQLHIPAAAADESPASEGEEEELMMEEEEEEVLTGASAEDKSRRPPVKGPSEPVHPALTVLRAFPCRSRLGDADTAATMEEEIYQSLLLRGLSLVGWYHSHPYSPALPSLQDIDAQMEYQLRLQGSSNGFQPCLALLCSPYYSGNPGPESKISPFWVMPPPEMLLVEFYKGAPDLVRFQEPWNQEHTYLDKLKISLASRTPKDQGLCHVLEQVYSVLKQGS